MLKRIKAENIFKLIYAFINEAKKLKIIKYLIRTRNKFTTKNLFSCRQPPNMRWSSCLCRAIDVGHICFRFSSLPSVWRTVRRQCRKNLLSASLRAMWPHTQSFRSLWWFGPGFPVGLRNTDRCSISFRWNGYRSAQWIPFWPFCTIPQEPST